MIMKTVTIGIGQQWQYKGTGRVLTVTKISESWFQMERSDGGLRCKVFVSGLPGFLENFTLLPVTTPSVGQVWRYKDTGSKFSIRRVDSSAVGFGYQGDDKYMDVEFMDDFLRIFAFHAYGDQRVYNIERPGTEIEKDQAWRHNETGEHRIILNPNSNGYVVHKDVFSCGDSGRISTPEDFIIEHSPTQAVLHTSTYI